MERIYNDKELARKGFIPVSPRAALVSPHKPPVSCNVSDYEKLPPKIKALYNEKPQIIGRFRMHHIKVK